MSRSAKAQVVQERQEQPGRETIPPVNLRRQALLFYCYEAQGTSIADMASTPPFNTVTRRTLEHWSVSDQWQVRRRQAEEEWTGHIQKRIGDKVVQKRIAQLEFLDNLEDEIGELLKSGKLRFKTLEGAINSYLRVAQYTDALREKVLADYPGARDSTPGCMPTVNLSEEEAFVAAQAILEHRRNNNHPTPVEQDQP